MFESLKRRFSAAVLTLSLVQIASPCSADDLPFRISRIFHFKGEKVGKKPATNKDGCVEELAKNIDWLEHHLNINGTVVAKAPDIWGEARLTAHRQEFEEVLRAELWNFQKNAVHGSEFVSDSAMLSFALQANSAPSPPPSAPKVSTKSLTMSAPSTVLNFASSTPVTTSSSSSPSAASSSSTPALPTLTANVPFGAAAATNPFVTTAFATPIVGAPSVNGPSVIQVEQTEMLDQLANYINHLQTIRRNNEGPDSADAPGYSMNLMRIPVSVLPGHTTKQGYGAEITITAEPYLGEELLPTAFREFVVNDLLDQLALPFAQYLNDDPAVLRYVAEVIMADDDVTSAKDLSEMGSPEGSTTEEQLAYYLASNPDKSTKLFVDDDDCFEFDRDEAIEALQRLQRSGLMKVASNDDVVTSLNNAINDLDRATANATQNAAAKEDPKLAREHFLAWQKLVSIAQNSFLNSLGHSSSSATRRSTLPFPPNQLAKNFGPQNLCRILMVAYMAVRQDLVNRQVVHLSDLSGMLREEISAAYDLLLQPSVNPVWELEQLAGPEEGLAELIRTRNLRKCYRRRLDFEKILRNKGWGEVTSALAWCLYTDSILLNARLNQDINKTFGNNPTNFRTQCATQQMAFYGPNPDPQARDMFREFVKVRWPIHVFALDPQINEQNIQDVRTIYRQMQLAVAVNFASGNVGINSALQAMRRLQRDRATIDLNRIAISFGHGDDTFGWRFTPRFQTPPVESNAKVFFRDLIVGGPTDQQLESSKAIEPGMRECNAIIIMPSFVPHVTLRTRGSWYKLNCPTHTGDSMHDTMQYSRAVKQMQCQAEMCCQCAHLYRDGEVERLLARMKQLENKMAVQTLECQVPIENTNGGHEILSSGRRELAPELHGWYGAPGYDPEKGTTIFLSGDSFSVTQSRLIVGNQMVNPRLLSRQILQVDLPPGLSVMQDRHLDNARSTDYDGYVDAQLATPYGVSSHVLIPVLRSIRSSITIPTVKPTSVTVNAVMAQSTPLDPTTYTVAGFEPPETSGLFRIDIPPNSLGADLNTINVVFFTSASSQKLLNSGVFQLTKTVDGPGFQASPDFFTQQFPTSTAGSSSTLLLGSVISNHITFLFKNGKRKDLTQPVTYQLGVGVTTGASTAPVIRALNTINITVKLTPPPPPLGK